MFGDLPASIDVLALPALWRRLYAVAARVTLQREKEARLLAALQNAPHWKPKNPVRWQDLLGRAEVDEDAFHERERASYDRRIDDLLAKDQVRALSYAESRRGREQDLVREAAARRVERTTGVDLDHLVQIIEAIPDG